MKLLLVRLRSIGDVVFTTPLIAALRARYAAAHLAYVVEPDAAPIVQGNPHLNDVIVVPRQRGLSGTRDIIRTARHLRRQRFDIAIDLHGGSRAAWLTLASGAPMRIGYTITGRSWMYTHVVRRAAQLTPRHSVRNQWDLLGPLGFSVPDPAQHPVEMTLDANALARVRTRLTAAGIGGDNPLIVVHFSASNGFRRWPPESFVEVIVRLARQDPRRRCALLIGPADVEVAGWIIRAARTELGPLAASMADLGRFELPEVHALIASAAVYIGGDTGPMHIATTTATPVVAIIGPTLAERSSPWRPPGLFSAVLEPGPLPCRPCHERRCIPGDFRCLMATTPDRVVDAAERALRPS